MVQSLKEIEEIAKDLIAKLDTPYAFSVMFEDQGRHLATVYMACTSVTLAVFMLNLTEQLIKHGENDDEILQIYQLLRVYVKKNGGMVRPAKLDDDPDST